ncbi:MAG: efflux RND transporter periplasmic adaptor subunit [Chloroflexi bacterium]|nr:efflux RND transporter periplasmic adaptor subunit [Chloroflexota bacterium]
MLDAEARRRFFIEGGAIVNEDLFLLLSTPETAAQGWRALVARGFPVGEPGDDLTAFEQRLDRLLARSTARLYMADPLGIDIVVGYLTLKYNEVVKGASEADLRAAEQAVVSAEANLAQAQNNLATLKAQPDAETVRQAELALEQAKDSMNSANVSRDNTCRLKGKDSAECRQANQQVNAQIAALNAAQAKYDEAVKPAKAEDIAAAEKAVQGAEAGLEAARARLAALKAGPTAAELAAAKSALDSAKAALDSKLRGASAEDLALGEISIKQAEIAVEKAELDLKGATIEAPFDGVVASVGASAGEQVGSGVVMFTLVDPKEVRVDVTVSETDIGKVAVGKAARVTFDALPNQVFEGKVEAVSPTATVQQGVVSYLVSVEIDARGVSIPTGLTASASIITEEKEGVLLVPNRAITLQGRNRVVTVLVNGKEEVRPVQVGMSNEQFTEVVSGVNEGEQVLIKTTSTTAPRIGSPGMGPAVGGGPVIIGR